MGAARKCYAICGYLSLEEAKKSVSGSSTNLSREKPAQFGFSYPDRASAKSIDGGPEQKGKPALRKRKWASARG
jgi:hypothetical protein